jgi:hypothetical protein
MNNKRKKKKKDSPGLGVTSVAGQFINKSSLLNDAPMFKQK